MHPLSSFISFRFVLQLVSIYSCFLCWGYLQEKITSTPYQLKTSVDANIQTAGWRGVPPPPSASAKWTFSCALNLCMAASGALTASMILWWQGEPPPIKSFRKFWYAACTCAAASPIGYASLQYINYPMMVLTKTMKPVPVLLVGFIGYGKRYDWYQYVTVMCLSGGLALYSFASDGKKNSDIKNSLTKDIPGNSTVTMSIGIPGVITITLEVLKIVWGIILICVNLTLDGYTNNEQDKIFAEDKISGLQMMKYTNIWQVMFIALYLTGDWLCFKSSGSSEFHQALQMLMSCPEIQRDIVLFCLCASLGQILVFQIMEEHGSLVWITISITRKLFTILVSVIAFQHSLNLYQCVGIGLVFAGIALEITQKNRRSEPKGLSAAKIAVKAHKNE